MPLSSCRSCGSASLNQVLSLGEMPLANALPTAEQLAEPEKTYPLEVVFCAACSLLQLTESVPPPDLFSEYAYFSSRSEPMVAHARTLVEDTLEDRRLTGDSLVVEVASNDGYLLQHYVAAGVPVLGIDPAENVAEAARANGVPTLCEFFTTDMARLLRDEGRRVDVIHANNVLAHVPDINDFVSAISTLLADDGVAIIETPYVGDLIEKLEFDTIYHEHVFYYTLRAAEELFERNGLSVVHVEHIPMHGGSLRIHAEHRGRAPARDSVLSLRASEEERGLDNLSFYEDFAARVHRLIADIRSFLTTRTKGGRAIAGYGAAAKATVMLNALAVGPETIRYIVDGTPYKQGRYMPGVRIPVVPPSFMRDEQPDDVMIFAWNFASEIAAKEAWYPVAGGTFLVPLPVPGVFVPMGPSST